MAARFWRTSNLLPKAFGRIGSAYEKQGDLANAVEFYQRSLTEHRTPDILAKLRAAEKNKITAERDAYLESAEGGRSTRTGKPEVQRQRLASCGRGIH